MNIYGQARDEGSAGRQSNRDNNGITVKKHHNWLYDVITRNVRL
jgi:hypothetical protein